MFACILALVPFLYYGMELTPFSYVFLLLFACSMERGQEETSTNQVGCMRGAGRDSPSTSSIISSLSMEELRSYATFSIISILSYRMVRLNPLSIRKMVQYILLGNSSQSGFVFPFCL